MSRGFSRAVRAVLGTLLLAIGIGALRHGLFALAESPRPVDSAQSDAALAAPSQPDAAQRKTAAPRPRFEAAGALIRGDERDASGRRLPSRRARSDFSQPSGSDPERGSRSASEPQPDPSFRAAEPAAPARRIGARLLLRDARLDRNHLLSQAWVAATTHRGEVAGLALAEIEAGSLLAAAELEDGDRILRVNGVDALGQLGQRAALRELAESDRWLLEIDGMHGPRSLEIVGPDANRDADIDLASERLGSSDSEAEPGPAEDL
jgi:hypothetical protein